MVAKIYLLAFLTLCVSISSLIAQRNTPHEAGLSGLYTGEAVSTFDLGLKTIEGSTYWLDQWHPAAILMTNNRQMTQDSVKYDLSGWRLEVKSRKAPKDIRVVPGNIIKEFTLDKGFVRHRFINLKAYYGLRQNHFGFFEVIEEGETLVLLRKAEAEILKSNYVPALDAGNRNDEMIKVEKNYIFDTNSKTLSLLPKSKKKIGELLIPYKSDVLTYISEKKLKPKKLEDLQKLIIYCNQD